MEKLQEVLIHQFDTYKNVPGENVFKCFLVTLTNEVYEHKKTTKMILRMFLESCPSIETRRKGRYVIFLKFYELGNLAVIDVVSFEGMELEEIMRKHAQSMWWDIVDQHVFGENPITSFLYSYGNFEISKENKILFSSNGLVGDFFIDQKKDAIANFINSAHESGVDLEGEEIVQKIMSSMFVKQGRNDFYKEFANEILKDFSLSSQDIQSLLFMDCLEKNSSQEEAMKEFFKKVIERIGVAELLLK